MAIKHRHQSLLANANADVDVDEWNDSHILDGGSNGQVLIRDSTQLDGWNWTSSPAFAGTPTGPTAPVGTNSTQLATTAFVQANMPAALARFSGYSNQVASIPAGGAVSFITLNGEDFDVGNMHAGASTDVVGPYTGGYFIAAQVNFAPVSGAFLQAQINVNGVSIQSYTMTSQTGGIPNFMVLSTVAALNANSVVKLGIWQNSAGAVN